MGQAGEGQEGEMEREGRGEERSREEEGEEKEKRVRDLWKKHKEEQRDVFIMSVQFLPGLWFVHFVYKCNTGDSIMLGLFPHSYGLGLKGHIIYRVLYYVPSTNDHSHSPCWFEICYNFCKKCLIKKIPGQVSSTLAQIYCGACFKALFCPSQKLAVCSISKVL